MALSRNQQEFVRGVQRATGLDARVIATWIVLEVGHGAKKTNRGDFNFLNIGNTDGGDIGSRTWASSDPAMAGYRSGLWLRGHYSVPGFGHAADGIQAIAGTASRGAAEQIRAIVNSPWASSHYGGEDAFKSAYDGVSGVTSSGASRSRPGAPETNPLSRHGDGALRALLTIGLVGAGATLAYLGLARTAGVQHPIRTPARVAGSAAMLTPARPAAAPARAAAR